jgi:hypothetical protein
LKSAIGGGRSAPALGLSTGGLAVGGDRCRFEADSTPGAVAAWLSQIAQSDSAATDAPGCCWQAKAALRHAAVPVLVVVFERSSAAEFAAVVISVMMAARL